MRLNPRRNRSYISEEGPGTFPPTWWDPDGDGQPGPITIPNIFDPENPVKIPNIPYPVDPIEIPNIFDDENPIRLPRPLIPGDPTIFPTQPIFKNPIQIPNPFKEPIYFPGGIEPIDPDGDGRPGKVGRDYEPWWWDDPIVHPNPGPPHYPAGAPWPPPWPDPLGDPPDWWPSGWNWPPDLPNTYPPGHPDNPDENPQPEFPEPEPDYGEPPDRYPSRRRRPSEFPPPSIDMPDQGGVQ